MKLYSATDILGENNYPVQLDTSQTALSGKAYVHVPIVTPLSGAGIQYDDDGTIRINPNNIETWTFTLRDDEGHEEQVTRRFVVINESCHIQVETNDADMGSVNMTGHGT